MGRVGVDVDARRPGSGLVAFLLRFEEGDVLEESGPDLVRASPR